MAKSKHWGAPRRHLTALHGGRAVAAGGERSYCSDF